MGKSQHGKWWLALVDDVRKFLQSPGLKRYEDAKRRDSGSDDGALREHWYWTGYLTAMDDLLEMRKAPSGPKFGGKT